MHLADVASRLDKEWPRDSGAQVGPALAPAVHQLDRVRVAAVQVRGGEPQRAAELVEHPRRELGREVLGGAAMFETIEHGLEALVELLRFEHRAGSLSGPAVPVQRGPTGAGTECGCGRGKRATTL